MGSLDTRYFGICILMHNHVSVLYPTQMPLQITRSFVENRDGTYDAYEPPIRASMEGTEGSKHQTPIRPFELKTYLKVG